jgi:G:T/U-mismatch repair DNA glycosylase
MEKSLLVPFLRKNLDILFVGLNPAKGSSRNKHYFSVNQAFWNQLYTSGLIIQQIDKAIADDIVFGTSKINFNNWNFGITDLVVEVAESNSSKIKPTYIDFKRLKETIITYKPRTVVLLHGSVLKYFLNELGIEVPESNSGHLGEILNNCETTFFNIAFPHGNSITSEVKIERYKELKKYIIINT